MHLNRAPTSQINAFIMRIGKGGSLWNLVAAANCDVYFIGALFTSVFA